MIFDSTLLLISWALSKLESPRNEIVMSAKTVSPDLLIKIGPIPVTPTVDSVISLTLLTNSGEIISVKSSAVL